MAIFLIMAVFKNSHNRFRFSDLQSGYQSNDDDDDSWDSSRVEEDIDDERVNYIVNV